MSITNKLNQIKNAIYGKEVRGAIHDAIKQVYDDASVNHDNANMEVKMARGTHNTLNDRLDNVDEIQAQTNAQLSQIDMTKAEKSEIGSPLIANSVSEMTDTEKVYVNLSDGHWYSHNGSEWIDGGIYNSQGIADNSITYEKLDGELKLNQLVVEDNKYVDLISLRNSQDNHFADNVSGALSPSTGTVFIGKINVDECGCYLITSPNLITGIVMYDDDKMREFIALSQNDFKFVIPVGVKKVGFNIQIKEPHTEDDFISLISATSFKKVTDGNVTTLKVLSTKSIYNENSVDNYFSKSLIGKNKYDSGLATDKIYYNTSDGKLIYNDKCAISGQIKVEPNTEFYRMKLDNVINLKSIHSWNEFGEHIGENIENVIWDSDTSFILLTSPNTHYISFTFMFNQSHNTIDFDRIKNTIQFEKVARESESPYTTSQFMYRLSDSVYVGKDRWQGAKGLAFGDSITEGTNGGYIFYLEDILNATIKNHGKSGANSQELLNIVKSVKSYDGIDFVTIQIGTNDEVAPTGTLSDIPNEVVTGENKVQYFNSFANTFYGNLSHVIEWIQYNNNSIMIYLITPPPSAQENLNNNAITHRNALIELSNYYNIPLIDSHKNAGICQKYMSRYSYDGTHFNLLGNELWGKYIGSKM